MAANAQATRARPAQRAATAVNRASDRSYNIERSFK
jgi:hypothetical protein